GPVAGTGGASFRQYVDDRPSRQVARHHRVINAFGAEAVDEPACIAGDECSRGPGPTNRPANRNQKRREAVAARATLKEAVALEQLDQSLLQGVGAPAIGGSIFGGQIP